MTPILQFVAKVTVTAALGLIAAWLARGQRAAVRHTLLAAAFAVLLVLPAVSLIAPPIRVAIPVAAHRASLDDAIDSVAQVPPPHELSTVAPAIAPSSGPSLPTLLAWGWIAGALLSLLPIIAGLWGMRTLRRSAVPWPAGQRVVDELAAETGLGRRVQVLLHETLSGPMTCGVWHPAILLSPEAPTWAPADLRRAMVHELEHVRCADYITHCVARAVCALYWFHPLVWIAWRQLALEAERACDDAVLGRSEATAYADQLVALARRMSGGSKSPLLAMAGRADLAARVRALLDGGQRRGRAGAFPVALASVSAVAFALAMSPVKIVAAPQSVPAKAAPQTVLSQSTPQSIDAPSVPQPATAQTAPQFDAVSVKLVDPDMQGDHSHENIDPSRLRMSMTMHRFVLRAYGITDGQLRSEPDWFKSRQYSIEAVTSAPASEGRMLLMLRGVLEDRFQLKLRQEDRDLPVYFLEVASGGPKFKELKPGEDSTDPPDRPGILSRSFSSMSDLVNALNGLAGRLTLDRTVVDRTHLTGDYNIQLETEIESQTGGLGHRTTLLPNLVHDIQSQLGLKLVQERAKMPYFVVERAAAPTPN